MLSELKNLLARNEDVEEETLKQAAYALLSQQFLHRARPRQRKQYETVVRFQTYFINLMHANNQQLAINENHGYVGIIPQDYTRRMKLEETLFLLTLRYIYDEEINAFHAHDDGSVDISIEDLQVRYQQLTKRDLPYHKMELDAWTQPLVQLGIIDSGNDPTLPEIYRIKILPSITAVLNADALTMLEMYTKADAEALAYKESL